MVPAADPAAFAVPDIERLRMTAAPRTAAVR
jgi:hypothetical protein